MGMSVCISELIHGVNRSLLMFRSISGFHIQGNVYNVINIHCSSNRRPDVRVAIM